MGQRKAISPYRILFSGIHPELNRQWISKESQPMSRCVSKEIHRTDLAADTIRCEELKCKQIDDINYTLKGIIKRLDDLTEALEETRENVQVLLDLERMRDIDRNKEAYFNTLTAEAGSVQKTTQCSMPELSP